MLAGLGPAPAVLFVVAADEGWRQQSAEHLAAVDALGIRHGLLVVTRSDLADPAPALGRGARAAARRIQPRRGARRSRSRRATGAGLDDLRGGAGRLVGAAAGPRPAAHGCGSGSTGRSPIRGSGTVVTGTLGGGALAVGDELRARRAATVRVRGLQSLGRPRRRRCRARGPGRGQPARRRRRRGRPRRRAAHARCVGEPTAARRRPAERRCRASWPAPGRCCTSARPRSGGAGPAPAGGHRTAPAARGAATASGRPRHPARPRRPAGGRRRRGARRRSAPAAAPGRRGEARPGACGGNRGA